MRAHLLLAPVLSATALLVGCEWTSSDGITWDESYNNVNFSGTYNLGTGLTTFRQNITRTTEEQVSTSGGAVKSKQYEPGVSAGIVGGVVRAGTFSVAATAHYADAVKSDGSPNWKTYETSFFDNGLGDLTSANDGTGKIEYETGSWSIPTEWYLNLDQNHGAYGTPVLTKTVVHWRLVTTTNTVPESSEIVLQYITVHQTGQNVTMTFDNGYTFSGKISGYSTDSDSIEHATSVIAKFNVSGANGKIVGTLNSFATSRQIDGVWTQGHTSHAVVGSAVGTGRTISENIEPTRVSTNADAVE